MGFPFSLMLDIQNLGIISGVEAIGMTMTLGNQSTDGITFLAVLRCHDKLLWITAEDINKKVSLAGFAITRVGKEILSLGKFTANIDYFKSVGVKVKEMGCEVRIGDCNIIGDRIELHNPIDV